MAFTAAAVLAGDRNVLAFGSGRRSGARAVRSAADAHRLGLRLLPPGHACPRSAQADGGDRGLPRASPGVGRGVL